jgi:hypothetical protein
MQQPSSSHLPRSPTPVPSSEAPSAEAVAAEDAILSQSIVTILDIKSLDSKVTALWRDKISKLLPPLSEVGDGDALVKPGGNHALGVNRYAILIALFQMLWNIVFQCSSHISLPSQVR